MKTEILYQNENWLRQKYIEERLSIPQIANKYKSTSGTIWNWLKKFKIPTISNSERFKGKDNPNFGNYWSEEMRKGMSERRRGENSSGEYLNREWLYKKYIIEKLSAVQISKLCNISDVTVGHWLHKFDIPCHEEKLCWDKNWLEKKYLEEKLTIRQIGKEVNRNNITIFYHLQKFNIPIRSKHEAQANHCKLSKEAIEWLNGELLGDGCLLSYSPYSAKFAYSSKYLEYIQYVSDTLQSFGIKQSGKIRKTNVGLNDSRINGDCYIYCYNSPRYVELLPVRKKWYPNGKKIVPRDMELTPLTCRQWYIGDGSLKGKTRHSQPFITLATNNFTIEDVEWLKNQLKKLNFKTTRRPSDNSIGISSVYSTKDFLNYIGLCPVKCYQYKWAYVG